jgi:16S rRNA (cytidine1402-2'-O)-methyltransferase
VEKHLGLTLVPTPIGNLEDITLRALRVLKEADLILAEDTRTTKPLLLKYAITTPLSSFHQHNEHHVLKNIIAQLQSGKNIALVSDAGTPGISDPGFLLVRECIKENIPVQCLPGATAFVPALVSSGFPCDAFVFLGFLPQKKGRQTEWKKIAEEKKTVVFYESPHRLMKALEEAKTHVSDQRQMCVCREISKLHEEKIRGNAEELLLYFQKNPPRGEIVVIISAHE